jgi:phosphoglucosamine mutase
VRFGTDGIRGDAERDLTTTLVVALGRAAARVFGIGTPFVVGRDTRESGPRIVADLAAGIARERGTIRSAGVLPTPGVAFASQQLGAPAAMVSASHNVWSDNGVKLFAPGGTKLSDVQQAAIEAAIAELSTDAGPSAAPALDDDPAPHKHYEAHLLSALDTDRLGALRVVLDCANGAASALAPEVFRSAGARVDVIAADPDGRNINDHVGSSHPEQLQRAVVDVGADLGLAFDGDADRCIAVDARGALVDGDQIMYALAVDLHSRRELAHDTVVVTVMSNLGLRRALRDAGIDIYETPVGDRAVLAALEANGYVLGGEQSGHVIMRDRATTGDGILTGVLLADLVARRRQPLHELVVPMQRLPQVLDNVRLDEPFDLAGAEAVWSTVRTVETELAERGRVLVRASGTEPLVRIMIEAPTDAEARAAASRVRAAVESAARTGPD